MSEHHWLAVIFIAIPIGVGLAVVTFPTNNRVTRDWCDKRITEIADALKPLNIPGWMKVFGVITWALLFLSFVLGSFFVIFYGIAQLPQVTGLTTALTGTDPDGIEAGDYRWYLLTLTALTAGLGAAVALPFTIRRSIQNERQTKTQEESHVTEQINEAVANLAAQKEVNRLGRTLTYIEDGETKSVFEWQDSPFELPKDAKEDTDKSTPWIHVTVTEPNIEVRIGAILSLERLARQRAEASQVTTKRTEDSILDHDGARDHVRIMQILCAYVRENAKAENAQTFAPQSFDEFIAGLTKEQRAEIDEDPLQSKDRAYRTHLDALIGELETPRTDLQIALRVLGRRTEVQRACEGVETEQKGTVNGTEITRHDWAGYRLDLRDSNLRHVDLGHGSADPMDLRHTRLEGAQFQGANLRDAQLQGADFGRAQLQGAILKDAQLQGANLGGAQLQGANLERAQLQGTYLRDAQLQGANLWEAQLQGADLARAQLQGAILWGAQLQGANLGSAQLQGANLGSAQLQGADLGRAKLQGANLEHAQLQGANLYDAQLQGANLRDAQLQGAKLRDAQLQGANLGGADLTSTNWTAAQATASLVKFVDLRGATGLTQGRLSSLIGNAATLLPEVLDDGSKPVLYDRWETEPEGFEALVENLKRLGENEAETRKAYLCEDGQKPRQVGIPLALDADPPWGPHPPNSDEAREWVKQQESARS